MLVVMLGLAHGAAADGLRLGGGNSNRMAAFERKVRVLDGRLAAQYSEPSRPDARSAGGRGAAIDSRDRAIYLASAQAAALRHGVPQDIFLRLVTRESGWNPKAVSAKGAVGLAQLMPQTAALLGVNINDPQANLDGGARYLRIMFDRFGSWRLALAAYNAGPKAVEAAGGVPDYAETVAYVAAILG